MKLVYSTLTGLAASAAIEDDAVLLSTASVRSALGAESMSSLVDFAQESSPRKAQKLLQTFVRSTLERHEAVDNATQNKLKEIAAQLTNNTYMSLEQSHRRDQDRLNMHWRAIQECGDKHIAHLRQDVDSLEVQLVRVHETNMIRCRGLPNHTNAIAGTGLLQEGKPLTGYGVNGKGDAWKQTSNKEGNTSKEMLEDIYEGTYLAISADGHRYFKHAGKIYDDPNNLNLLQLKNEVCEKCSALESFVTALEDSKPACEAPMTVGEVDPKCTTSDEPVIETDLAQYFANLHYFVDGCTPTEPNCERGRNGNGKWGQWTRLKKACDDAKAAYKAKDDHCDGEQTEYEQSFCAYRQGLHSTCTEYQGCHILSEEKFLELIQDSLYAADSRKIDWKAIHKIACYIKVLVSDCVPDASWGENKTCNDVRADQLTKCESGDLNTLATILTGFNETNYLSLIIPEISGNVSCWDLEVPPLIDFKECDMTSVHQYPCTPTWNQRYEGLESPTTCTKCSALSAHATYSDKNYQQSNHAKSTAYGGGWIFVNEMGRSTTDIDDLQEIQVDGYHLPNYNVKGLRWNEVLIQRTSSNWCDSWGRQTSTWVEPNGASMCVQSDDKFVYCMSNHNDEHTWRQQPISHFAALCGKEGQPACECWPFEGVRSADLKELHADKICFAHGGPGAAAENKLAPKHIHITSLEQDGSVVKVSFHGEEKTGRLRVGNYGSFLDGVGCGAATPVSYRVYVRCVGCTTERADFHSKDGAQFNSPMKISHCSKRSFPVYTFEAWFRSPLEGSFDRELFGGGNGGLVLVKGNENHCHGHYGDGVNERTTYRLHVPNTNTYSKFCFQKNMMYHVAATRDRDEKVTIYVNGHDVTGTNVMDETNKPSDLGLSFGTGFTDGGQLFNVRIWDIARTKDEILEYSAITKESQMDTLAGLSHWWPLSGNIQDTITLTSLTGDEIRYAPVWCSDLEATGMRVC